MFVRNLTTLSIVVLTFSLILCVVSCGNEGDDIKPMDSLIVADTTTVASSDSIDADTSLSELLAQTPEPDDRPDTSDRTGSRESEAPGDRSPGDTAADSPSLSAGYRLATVDGNALPVALVEGPDCVVELIRGNVRIRDDRTFELETSTHENCGGEISNDQLHQATGTVVLDGGRLRFDATDGEAFAVAHGRYLPAGRIVIEHLEFEGGEHEVRWEFAR